MGEAFVRTSNMNPDDEREDAYGVERERNSGGEIDDDDDDDDDDNGDDGDDGGGNGGIAGGAAPVGAARGAAESRRSGGSIARGRGRDAVLLLLPEIVDVVFVVSSVILCPSLRYGALLYFPNVLSYYLYHWGSSMVSDGRSVGDFLKMLGATTTTPRAWEIDTTDV